MGKIFITGGAGFIGSNAVQRFLRQGQEVVVFDNFSRNGCHYNLSDLKTLGGKLEVIEGDIRDRAAIEKAVARHADSSLALHLAAQVAVTSSVTDPRTDFDINALGTFNVLEALRAARFDGLLAYSSTNKVYGEMGDAATKEAGGRYGYTDLPHGVPESMSLDFHSPYGCSKGTADQYVLDYSRIYGLKTAVFRQSCIYGPHQYGIEDQGWVAWFAIAAVTGKPVTIYGDGKQVRDVLFVDDLVDAYWKAFERRNEISGQAFNMGGGPANTLSLLELIALLRKRLGIEIPLSYGPTRPGDQKVFIADIRKAEKALGWTPSTGVETGIGKLVDWVSAHRERFR